MTRSNETKSAREDKVEPAVAEPLARGVRRVVRRLGLNRAHVWLIWLTLLAAAWSLLTPNRVYPSGGQWDETFYSAQASSIAYDFDYDIANDFFHTMLTVWRPGENQWFTILDQLKRSEPVRGRSVFAIGSSLMWVPGIVLARVIGLGEATAPGVVYTQRFTPQILAFMSFWSVFLCGLTVYGAYVLARLYRFSKSASAASACICLVLTPLAFFSFRTTGYSHMSSAFAVTFFFLACVRYSRRRGAGAAAVVGLLGGLTLIVRWADALFLLLGMAVWGRWLIVEIRSGGYFPRRSLVELAVGLLAFVSVGLFQAVFWKLNEGQWITSPHAEYFMHWTKPLFPRLLWNYRNSFLPWAPASWFAMIGLVVWIWKRPGRASLYLTILAVALYVAACTDGVHGGFSLGQRRLVGLYPILVIGMANFIRVTKLDRSAGALGACVLMSLTLGLFLVRLRETGVRDMLAAWRESGWWFGSQGAEAVRLMARSDYLTTFHGADTLATPVWLCALFLILLWGAWQLSILAMKSSAIHRLRSGPMIGALIVGLYAFHGFMIATDGRDDPQARSNLVQLKRALEEAREQDAFALARGLEDDPRYELQAKLLVTEYLADRGRYDLAIDWLGPLLPKTGSMEEPGSFPQIRRAVIQLVMKGAQAGQVKIGRTENSPPAAPPPPATDSPHHEIQDRHS